MPTAAKAKVTVSLDREVLSAVDERVRNGAAPSRSAAVEAIIRQWREEEAQRKLERDTEAYYLALSGEEQQGDQEWAEFAGRAAAPVWKDEGSWTNPAEEKSTSPSSQGKTSNARQ